MEPTRIATTGDEMAEPTIAAIDSGSGGGVAVPVAVAVAGLLVLVVVLFGLVRWRRARNSGTYEVDEAKYDADGYDNVVLKGMDMEAGQGISGGNYMATASWDLYTDMPAADDWQLLNRGGQRSQSPDHEVTLADSIIIKTAAGSSSQPDDDGFRTPHGGAIDLTAGSTATATDHWLTADAPQPLVMATTSPPLYFAPRDTGNVEWASTRAQPDTMEYRQTPAWGDMPATDTPENQFAPVDFDQAPPYSPPMQPQELGSGGKEEEEEAAEAVAAVEASVTSGDNGSVRSGQFEEGPHQQKQRSPNGGLLMTMTDEADISFVSDSGAVDRSFRGVAAAIMAAAGLSGRLTDV